MTAVTEIHLDDNDNVYNLYDPGYFEVWGYAGNDSITLYDGEGLLGATVHGGDGADMLTGSSLPDQLEGDAGADTLAGGYGNDTLYGGDGNDILNGESGTDLVNGGAGDDNITVAEDDIAYGGDGNDQLIYSGVIVVDARLYGDAGNDTLDGGSGLELNLSGGDGNDSLIGSNTTFATLEGGLGDDTYTISNATSNVELLEYELEGNDTLVVRYLGFDLATTANIENLTLIAGEGGSYTGYGDDGHNELSAQTDAGFTTTYALYGRGGNDTLSGSHASDTLSGGDGNDTLDGGGGEADILDGGAGDDTYIVHNTSTDAISDVSGIDTVIAGYVNYTLAADLENLTLRAGEGTGQSATGNAADNRLTAEFGDLTGAAFALSGLDGNDTLTGAGKGDTLNGGNDSDVLSGAAGFDQLYGEAGDDVLNGGNGNDGLWSGAGNDTLNGDNGSDKLGAGDGDDVLNGGGDNDTLWAGAGNDTLVGGRGSDVMSGGDGADVFAFMVAFGTFGADTITDFDGPGGDKLHINSGLTNIEKTGELWSGRLALGAQAADANDRFVFDTTTGELYYDADGSGAGAQVLVVTLNTNHLSGSDIVLV